MEMKNLNLNAVKEIRDLSRKNDRNYFNFVSELEKILKTQKPGEWSMRPIYESGNTIDDSEVGSLCFFALSISDLRNVFVPFFCSCSRMDVVAFAEGFRHIGILAEMGHDA